MKKHILVLVLSLTTVLAFPQGFDDLAYSNPDRATYFQQEMTSLMRFQAENNLNIPFFLSFSGRIAQQVYTNEYINSLYFDYPGEIERINNGFATPVQEKMEINLLTGAQFRINNTFYIPVYLSFGGATGSDYNEFDIVYKGTSMNAPADLNEGYQSLFIGSGLFINTDKIKGGIYVGWSFFDGTEVSINTPVDFGQNGTFSLGSLGDNKGLKIALVPLVKTSEWNIIGKALDSILGYLGMGNVITNYSENEGDSKMSAFASAINAGLDLTFNRIALGSFSLDTQAIYLRGNFDASTKADTFGLKMVGLFSNFPFGFSLEGGYKQFYSVSKYFTDEYDNGTGYFNGSIFFPFKRITLGIIYKYDNVYQHNFGIALSTNFLSGLLSFNSRDIDNRFESASGFDWALRYRHGGWKANKE